MNDNKQIRKVGWKLKVGDKLFRGMEKDDEGEEHSGVVVDIYRFWFVLAVGKIQLLVGRTVILTDIF